jgi:hypothetical protein
MNGCHKRDWENRLGFEHSATHLNWAARQIGVRERGQAVRWSQQRTDPPKCGANMHILIYVGLCLAYLEAALESFAKRERHCALREIVIACLYISAALVVIMHGEQLSA